MVEPYVLENWINGLTSLPLLEAGKYPFQNFYLFMLHGSVGSNIYSSLRISVKENSVSLRIIFFADDRGFYSIHLLSKAQRKDVFTGLSADWEENTWATILFSDPVSGSNFFRGNTAFLLQVPVTCFLLSHQ